MKQNISCLFVLYEQGVLFANVYIHHDFRHWAGLPFSSTLLTWFLLCSPSWSLELRQEATQGWRSQAGQPPTNIKHFSNILKIRKI